jgi:hypothetical protein
LFTWQTEERLELRGRDTDLPAPMRLCPGCRARLRSAGARRYWLAAVLVLAAGVAIAVVHVPTGLAAIAVGLAAVYLVKWRAEAGRQRRLLDLLRPVPVYRQVLERYPKAVVLLKD